MIRRRRFVTLLGGAVAGLPLAARAQQPGGRRRLAVLMATAADDPESRKRLFALLQSMQQLGWVEGRNLRIDSRRAAGNTDDTRKYAAELIALIPDIILAAGSLALGPLLQATRTIPIVFTHVPDPVGAGFVDSMARPGGNATESDSPRLLKLPKPPTCQARPTVPRKAALMMLLLLMS